MVLKNSAFVFAWVFSTALVFATADMDFSALSSANKNVPFWMDVRSSVDDDKQRFMAINDILDVAGRLLQASTTNNTIAATPEEVCESYNESNETAGLLTCICDRFLEKDTEVNCTFTEPQCFSDNTTCYTSTFSQILNPIGQSWCVTSCTTFLSGPILGETCVRIFPETNGTYAKLKTCSATYTPVDSMESVVCQSCDICGPDDGVPADQTAIALNCCNAQTDVVQQCRNVSAASGVAVPFYDVIPPEEAGNCVSSSPTLLLSLLVHGPMVLASALPVLTGFLIGF